MSRPRVLVVVPAWNEAGNLGATLDELVATLPDTGVLVVDDGSTDGTADVARDRGVAVLRLPVNLGVGGAMRAGFRFARQHGYEVAVQLDADGQHDPAEVPALVAGLADADLVVGARFAGRGDYEVGGPRRLAMRLLALGVRGLTGTSLADVTSGFRATGPRALELFAEHYPAEYLGDTVESLVMAGRAGLRIAQVPVAMRPRRTGVPSQPAWKATLFVGRAVLVLALAAVRRPAPPTPTGRAPRSQP